MKMNTASTRSSSIDYLQHEDTSMGLKETEAGKPFENDLYF